MCLIGVTLSALGGVLVGASSGPGLHWGFVGCLFWPKFPFAQFGRILLLNRVFWAFQQKFNFALVTKKQRK